MSLTTTHKPSPANGPVPSANEMRPVTVPDFQSARSRGVRLTMLTAYDYTMARLLDAAGVDGLLVGDSLGMVQQGNSHSLAVTLDEVIYHTRCVARGVRRSLLVADMPFMTYQVSPQQALEKALKVSDHLPVWAEFSAYEATTPGRVAGRPEAFIRAQ